MINTGLDKLTQEDSKWQRLEGKATQVVEQYSTSQELARGRLQAESTWLRHQNHGLQRSAKANFPFVFSLVKSMLSLYASSILYVLFALEPIRVHKARMSHRHSASYSWTLEEVTCVIQRKSHVQLCCDTVLAISLYTEMTRTCRYTERKKHISNLWLDYALIRSSAL